MWYEITYPFSNFNSAIVEVWEWVSNFIPHFTGHVDISQCQYPMFAWHHRSTVVTFSALLFLCTGNSTVTGEFPSKRLVTWNIAVYFDLHLNKRLSKQSIRQGFEIPLCSLWHHCNVEGHHQALWNCQTLQVTILYFRSSCQMSRHFVVNHSDKFIRPD